MRLHRLELEGFGPFREQQVVDFDEFAADGIFLIAGRTGAGKSSVLDGICFALYGGVPRYDGAERRLRSDHSAPEDPTRVRVEFSAAGHRWRVTRSPEYERPKQRGTGLTTEPHHALLEQLDGDVWVARAARPVDVARELDEVLGLNQQQFLQVILLAQNRFAEFLLARSDDRQRLLRRLFGTRTYEEYQAALERRRKLSERELAAAGDGVALLLAEAERILGVASHDIADGVVGDVAARIAAATLGLTRAEYRVETLVNDQDAADAALAVAEGALGMARSLREKHDRRAQSRVALDDLERRSPAIADDRLRLERAVAAEALRSPLDLADRAAIAADVARRAVEALRDAWVAAGGASDADGAALAEVVDELTGRIALWSDAAAREDELEALERRLAHDRERSAEFAEILAALDAQRAALPARIAELDLELEGVRAAAAGLAPAEEGLAATTARIESAREAERLATALAVAEKTYLDAAAAHDELRSAVTTLLRRRLAGHAGELAASLVDGEPCAVCGSATHPAPAEPAHDPVTDDEIAAAERRRDRAAVHERAAEGGARAARTAHAQAAARAGGESVVVLEEVRAAAVAAVAAARAATVRRDRIARERADLEAADVAAEAERARLAAEQAEVRDGLATAEAEASVARAAVAEARGEHASVRERIAEATRLRTRASDLRDAAAAADAAETRRAETLADLAALLAESAFGDAGDATAALLDAVSRAALDERTRDHESALRAERERLRDLELALAGVPDEPVDVAAHEREHAAARARWKAVVDEAAAASATAARVRDLVSRATAEHDGLGALAEDHAVLARLADTVAGRAPNTHRMTLESFVLAAELEEIVDAANVRLEEMSQGRYRLLHSDALAARGAASGLGLAIMDAHTGQPRPAQSLSGGETFLASLALALGLAEVVTARSGGVRLDTLFIDEGFGSLDEETLELAMRTLDELRQGGRTVGLISHVPAMKDRLPAQLVVEATPQGPSVIRQDSAVPT